MKCPKLKSLNRVIPCASSELASLADEEQQAAMSKELANETIRDDVLIPLMTSTFNSRQLKIGEMPIAEVLKIYPALRRPSLVSNNYS